MTPPTHSRSTTARRVTVATVAALGVIATLVLASTPPRGAEASELAGPVERTPLLDASLAADAARSEAERLTDAVEPLIEAEQYGRVVAAHRRAEEERIAAEETARAEEERIAADRAAARRAATSSAMGGGWAALRRCESGGNYSAVSASGTYRGAYQFARSTWNSVAARSHPHLVGVDPAAAAPGDQDAMALALYRSSGSSPWPHCGRHV